MGHSDLHVHDKDQQATPVDEKVEHVGPVPGETARYVWLTFTKYLELAGLTNRVGQLECCSCHRSMVVTDMHTTMPVDEKNLICGPGYVFCAMCRVGEDPAHAYAHADADFQRRRNRPAPKVDRQLDKPLGL